MIIVYDITDLQTFINVKIWLKQIKESCKDEVALMLIGNKIDLEKERKVSYDEGQKLAHKYNFLFQEVSAAENKNLEECFEEIAT